LLKKDFYIKFLDYILKKGFETNLYKGEKIIIDYSSPNIAKQMSV
jgi:arginyl-tRNA synthetase